MIITKKNMNVEEIQYLLDLFVDEYGDDYKEQALKYILSNFWKSIHDPMATNILMQTYAEIGVEPEHGTFYNAHLHNIERLFGLDRNILEIAGGKIPAFAKKIARKQLEIKKGTITVYEPLLFRTTSPYPNLTLYKEWFLASEVDVKSYDLLIGLLPCESTEQILISACQNQKDFYVALCGCDHSSSTYSAPNVAAYQNHIIAKAKKLIKEYDNGILEVKRLNKMYDFDSPILYNRRVK